MKTPAKARKAARSGAKPKAPNGNGMAKSVRASREPRAARPVKRNGPDLLALALRVGSDESLARERDTTQAYVDYFSAHYQLYGRKIQLVPVKALVAANRTVERLRGLLGNRAASLTSASITYPDDAEALVDLREQFERIDAAERLPV